MFVRNMFNQIMRFPEKTIKNPVKSDNFQTGLKIVEARFYWKGARKQCKIQNFGKVRITANFKNSKKL